MKYYVYAYIDPRKVGIEFVEFVEFTFEHQPFYIGKGKDKRAWCHLDTKNDRSNNTLKKGKIDRIIRAGYLPEIIFLAEGLSEEDALQKEADWIAIIGTKWTINGIGRGPLCNMTAGGDGLTPSEEMRKRASRPGKLNPMYGKTHTDAAREKISVQSKKLKHSAETRQAMRDARSNGKNYNAKKWLILTPSGEEIMVDFLKEFAKSLGINYNTLFNTYKRKKPVSRGLASGYRLLGPI